MAQQGRYIGPNMGLVNGVVELNRRNGLASGFSKIQAGDESGWAEAFNADPETTMNAWNNQQKLNQGNKFGIGNAKGEYAQLLALKNDPNTPEAYKDGIRKRMAVLEKDPSIVLQEATNRAYGTTTGKYEGDQDVKQRKGWTTVSGQDKVLKGSEAEREWLANNSKTIKSNNTAIRAGKTVLADISDLKRLYKEDPSSISGFSASMVNFVPGTVAATAKAKADSIKGNVAVDNLLNIKQSGAGLGQVPQSQADMLSGLFGSLSQAQDDKEFMLTLDRIEKVYSSVISDAEKEVKGIYDKVYDPNDKEEPKKSKYTIVEIK